MNQPLDPQRFEAEWRRLTTQLRENSVVKSGTVTAFRSWLREIFRALTDFRFQSSVTESLLSAVYVLGIGIAVALPLLVVAWVWSWSPIAALVCLVTVAPIVALCLTATFRVAIEFVLATQRLADQVGSISDVAEDLHRNVNVPLAQLTGGLKTVGRFRRGARD